MNQDERIEGSEASGFETSNTSAPGYREADSLASAQRRGSHARCETGMDPSKERRHACFHHGRPAGHILLQQAQ